MSRWICKKCHFDHEATGEIHCPIYPFIEIQGHKMVNSECKGYILTNEDHRAQPREDKLLKHHREKREKHFGPDQCDDNEHDIKHLNLTTIGANNHCLSITNTEGKTQVFYLNVDQVLLIGSQAIMSLRTYYKVVPK